MNKSRFYFEIPKDKQIIITPYWLLGFAEGEGSFYAENKYNFVLGFAITQQAIDLALMEKKFFLQFKLNWKAILKLKQLGLQYLPEGLNIIKLIVSQMNNNRLSSNSSTKINRESLYDEINRLLSEPSNYEAKKNGSVFIKSLNRYISLKARDKVSVEVQDENGNIINKFDSITSCAKFYDISRSTTHRRLRNNEPVVVFIESKSFYVKLININNDPLFSQRNSSLTDGVQSNTESYINCNDSENSSKSNLKVGTILSQSPVNIYEKCSSVAGGGDFKLIGSFVSPRRAALFLNISGNTIIKYRNSGEIFKYRYKFSSK